MHIFSKIKHYNVHFEVALTVDVNCEEGWTEIGINAFNPLPDNEKSYLAVTELPFITTFELYKRI